MLKIMGKKKFTSKNLQVYAENFCLSEPMLYPVGKGNITELPSVINKTSMLLCPSWDITLVESYASKSGKHF